MYSRAVARLLSAVGCRPVGNVTEYRTVDCEHRVTTGLAPPQPKRQIYRKLGELAVCHPSTGATPRA